MKKKRCIKITGWIIGIIVAALLVLHIIDVYQYPERVAKMLNINKPPQSLHVIECNSSFVPTDVVITCSVEIDPAEFQEFLRGYQFTASTIKDTSNTAVITKTGPEFDVTAEYTAHPAEFKYGGHVKVIADAQRRRAIIDLYIE